MLPGLAGRGTVAFELEPDEPVDVAVRRVAREQVDDALGRLDLVGTHDPDDDPEVVQEAVHEARKCCKRLRGLVRLIRPALGDHYGAANRAARDAARELSSIRDAHALLATFDALVAARADQVPSSGLGPVRDVLVARADDATAHVVDEQGRVDAARDRLSWLRDDIPNWPLPDDDLLDAVAAGIARTAGRGRNRFADVVARDGAADDELLHQWRKRVKYAWYHAILLEPAAPTLLGAQADLLHDLSDALGDDHDLAVLAADLMADPDAWGGDEVVDGAMVLVDGTRRDLQRRAVAVGARLHAEDADAQGRRMGALVAAWWDHGPERDAGEVLDLHGLGDDLGERTNGELRDLARRVDLPGRSSLDRAGLLAALGAAGPSRD